MVLHRDPAALNLDVGQHNDVAEDSKGHQARSLGLKSENSRKPKSISTRRTTPIPATRI